MKNCALLSVFIIFICLITGCKSKGNLEEGTASDVISAYLKSNPEYETVRFKTGEIKFRSDGDKADLAKYKLLGEKGLFRLKLKNQKKKFLSKDSVYFYSIYLTDKAKPYILKQDSHNATVKAVDYILDETKPIIMIEGDSKIARVTASLKKEKNDFAIFVKKQGPSSNFITKIYKLKFKKDSWVLVRD